MKNFIALSFLVLACSDNIDPEQKTDCNIPEGSYAATYTATAGTCDVVGESYTELFNETDKRTWFPLILDLDDCVRTVDCVDSTIYGSSYCTRIDSHTSGTLGGDLVFDTVSNTGTIHIVISATSYHSSSTCESTYNVVYDVE